MPNVLIVDDSPVDRRLVEGLLGSDPDLKLEFAADGAEALAKIRARPPDLVVTDLVMPELDGLDLVTEVRSGFPEVPVILMTAHGSEALAIEALERGAAGYVPKARLADKLHAAVDQVLDVSRANHSFAWLSECLASAEYRFVLDNDPLLIRPLVDLVQQMLVVMRLCDLTGRIRVGVALEEALLNAMYRGNLELGFNELGEARATHLDGPGRTLVERRRTEQPYRDRRIHVDVKITADEGRFHVRDEGPGFDLKAFPDPHSLDTFRSEGGRGLVLMRTFMDEVTSNGAGNEVIMVKHREWDSR